MKYERAMYHKETKEHRVLKQPAQVNGRTLDVILKENKNLFVRNVDLEEITTGSVVHLTKRNRYFLILGSPIQEQTRINFLVHEIHVFGDHLRAATDTKDSFGRPGADLVQITERLPLISDGHSFVSTTNFGIKPGDTLKIKSDSYSVDALSVVDTGVVRLHVSRLQFQGF